MSDKIRRKIRNNRKTISPPPPTFVGGILLSKLKLVCEKWYIILNINYYFISDDVMDTWSIAGICVGVGVLLSIIAFMLCLWKYRKNQIRGFFKNIRRRRASTSHHPLEPDDTGSVDLPEPRIERQLFSIGDNDDQENTGGYDDYFYDEIFGHSAFVDERTNTSLKKLYTVQSEDVPDLLFRDPKHN